MLRSRISTRLTFFKVAQQQISSCTILRLASGFDAELPQAQPAGHDGSGRKVAELVDRSVMATPSGQ